MRKAIIFGISSDIGNGIAERLRKDSWTVVGTSTNPQKNGTVRLDLTKSDDIEALFANTSFLQDWSLLCFFSATMNPIGPFFSSDFLEWRKAFEINVFSQLQILHKIWDFRSSSSVPSVCFLAGGGTNSSFDNYSAYCLSKITLIKFVELIASENEDANFFIIGPGYMRTKIHNETLRAGELAGKFALNHFFNEW